MNFKKAGLVWIIPSSLLLGAGLSSLQPGNWWYGLAAFSFLILLSFTILQFSYRWASRAERSDEPSEERSRSGLALIIAIAFALRLLVGVSLYVFLPLYGHDEVDDR